MEKVEENWFKEGLRFKCTGCGKCCTGGPGSYVAVSDFEIEKLAEHLHLSIEEFKKHYTRVGSDQTNQLIDKPGCYDCIFLDGKKCSVYEARPIQCRTFPWWPHKVKSKEAWVELGKSCEGVNHPDAPLVSAVQIESQALTYLDQLMEQNFNFPFPDK